MKRTEAAGYDVYCGIDVGKDSHYARALAPDGERELLSRAVAQDESELAALFADLKSMGRVMAVVRSTEEAGEIRVRVEADGCEANTLTLKSI